MIYIVEVLSVPDDSDRSYLTTRGIPSPCRIALRRWTSWDCASPRNKIQQPYESRGAHSNGLHHLVNPHRQHPSASWAPQWAIHICGLQFVNDNLNEVNQLVIPHHQLHVLVPKPMDSLFGDFLLLSSCRQGQRWTSASPLPSLPWLWTTMRYSTSLSWGRTKREKLTKLHPLGHHWRPHLKKMKMLFGTTWRLRTNQEERS